MTTYEMVRTKAEAAHRAAGELAVTSTVIKNKALLAMADALEAGAAEILAANAKDMEAGRANNMKESMLDRLALSQVRINAMAEGLRQVAQLEDPVGNVLDGRRLPNGLTVTKVRVPLGVIGIIYEARPNVTADAIGLCVKSGNAVILKGGSEALQSNIVIAGILTQAAEAAGIPAGAIQFVDSSDRQAVTDLIKMNGLVDVVIPRGGAGLIQAVVQNATVPVIETGIGVCHTYVDAGADYDMARAIAINAKVQRPAVCNAMETLLVHEDAAAEFLPQMLTEYFAAGVTIIGCGKTQVFDKRIQAATEADWATEYGDLRLSVKIVSGLEAALAHIAKYGTKHSECIVTSDYNHARTFQQRVDAAAVYVNASTRFTDGFEFGFGAEIGISTQKLHARGPMALPELTSSKYLISGDGQIRG
ncbi:glutamate-5-semialdehyde dehydrogenase [Phascolarctobacterium faecium]|jgi:glutamate-5-semialdehyde dehydrogenase|uniref:glutamate-5-semialdehyde dehydrogenase n=1 Tax=Phascolarctobacterium faecium TaxID=33025 RepID=UPI000F0CCF2C|nr:glutamate-5-semialdehyde dehydrogenase [Phascolarctobacterium faecium]BBG63324.1 Gamma-glutamyl phosphate reductase [Phascolarctobacterium faecium]